MKIRTQLLLAFLLLSVLPLSGIVLYSYFSSLEAVRQAYAAEAKALTRDMDARLSEIRQSLNGSAPDDDVTFLVMRIRET